MPPIDIYNPSKPPFKFASLLFVATARQNESICSALALIATLIRGTFFFFVCESTGRFGRIGSFANTPRIPKIPKIPKAPKTPITSFLYYL